MKQAENTVPVPRGVGKNEPAKQRRARRGGRWKCPACTGLLTPHPIHSNEEGFAWCQRCRVSSSLAVDRIEAAEDARDLLGLLRMVAQKADYIDNLLPKGDPAETAAKDLAASAAASVGMVEELVEALALKSGQRLPGWRFRDPCGPFLFPSRGDA